VEGSEGVGRGGRGAVGKTGEGDGGGEGGWWGEGEGEDNWVGPGGVVGGRAAGEAECVMRGAGWGVLRAAMGD